MSDFKLKSIDEFDSLFFEEINPAKPEAAPEIIPEVEPEQDSIFTQAKPKESLIPEISTDSPKEVSDDIFTIKPENVSDSPFSVNNEQDYDDDTFNPFAMSKDNKTEEEEEPAAEEETVKVKSKGALAGKIVSIVMLALTVVVFILGCFVSVFLDNNGSDLAGYTFNTLAKDVESLSLSKGDLIIANINNEYELNDVVAFPSSTGDGCDLYVITQDPVPMGEEYNISASDLTDSTFVNQGSSSCYGAVYFYIPLLGSVINFAMQYAILVCVLFVLLAALWCLVLVLIEKSQTKKIKND